MKDTHISYIIRVKTETVRYSVGIPVFLNKKRRTVAV